MSVPDLQILMDYCKAREQSLYDPVEYGENLCVMAYVPLCWYLMARGDETKSLKVGDLVLDYRSPRYPDLRVVAVNVCFRKANQDDPHQGKS